MSSRRHDDDDRSSSGRRLDDASVGFLYVARQFQDRPYQPITSRKLSQAFADERRLRAPPHLVQKTFTDFYNAVNGKYGIEVEDPLQLQTSYYTRKRPREDDFKMNRAVGGGTAASAESVNNASVGESKMAQDLQDLRRMQLKRNQAASHAPKVCQYYNTREGCRRGINCPHVHK